jgi:predicted RNase H-like HicB family nuclease
MIPTTLQIKAIWDDEAKVWVATSEDILGLVTEAETLEKLVAKLKLMVPELLEANQFPMTHSSAFRLISERVESLAFQGG